MHAFDDQHFDLGRDELADDGDVGWTFAAAIEGSASWVEQEWRATLTPAEASLLRDEELSFDPGGLFSLDLGFLIYQTSVYDAGRIWIDRLVAEAGITAIDDVLINGAPSSEVVSMPLNAANLDPIEVASPAVDGEVLWEGRGGRALIAALTFLTDPGQIAATGWGGDAITVYRDRNGSACLRWDVVGDTARDTNELFEELSRWGIGVGGTRWNGGWQGPHRPLRLRSTALDEGNDGRALFTGEGLEGIGDPLCLATMPEDGFLH